jgi:hypothetical protein
MGLAARQLEERTMVITGDLKCGCELLDELPGGSAPAGFDFADGSNCTTTPLGERVLG